MTMTKIFLLLCLSLLAGFVFADDSHNEKEIGFYELKKGSLSVNLTNYGASIASVFVPDKNGKVNDIVLGYDSITEYMSDKTYFGATVGRVANRIGGATFTINGTVYKVDANEGKNMLHGGHKGFGDVVWKVKKHRKDGKTPCVVFAYRSPDGEEGFPGDLDVTMTYTLVGKNELSVKMQAKALNKATPVNLAQHAYWNLGGHTSGSILDHELQIYGSNITAVNEELIPTGELKLVKGTPYDFLEPKAIGKEFDKLPNGYDINYALDGKKDKNKKAAIVHDKKSGRVMKLHTSAPGLQFFSGGNTDGIKGKGGFVYKKNAGLALETQSFPDAVNHPKFPNTIVSPGKSYRHYMLFEFSTA